MLYVFQALRSRLISNALYHPLLLGAVPDVVPTINLLVFSFTVSVVSCA